MANDNYTSGVVLAAGEEGGYYQGQNGEMAGGAAFSAAVLFRPIAPTDLGYGFQTLWGNEDGANRGWSLAVDVSATAGGQNFIVQARLGTGAGTTLATATGLLPAPSAGSSVYHLAMVADGLELRLYLNGVRLKTAATAVGVASPAAPLVARRNPAGAESAQTTFILGMAYFGESFPDALIALNWQSCVSAGFDMAPLSSLFPPSASDWTNRFSARFGAAMPLGSPATFSPPSPDAAPTWTPQTGPISLTRVGEAAVLALKNSAAGVFAGA
jgi:hypothetical protein